MNKVKVNMVSLGCSKNRVDAELMLGALADFELTADPAQAEVIIVNTCGFIEAAKQESIETILEMAAYKETGALKVLVVTGCLTERYREELSRELPEVDVFLGMSANQHIAQAVREALGGAHVENYAPLNGQPDFLNRVLTTPGYMAYVRIAEGCNNRCTYCAIPRIRGRLVSREMDDIEREVRALAARGVSEVILVAQDTTRYGEDLYGRGMLPALIDRLAAVQGVHWLRVLYCYPENITDELLAAMARHDNVVKYIDMPVQHFDDGILRRMHRRNTRASTYDAVARIRAAHPDFVLRTTLIAGFPGESGEAYRTLLQGIEDLRFDRLGVFAYSQEEGTPAASLPGQLPSRLKQSRAARAMRAQQAISLEANRRRVGSVTEVLIEGEDEQGYFGRSYAEAPEIDGKVRVRTEDRYYEGEYVCVRITEADEYDLTGEPV